MHRPLSSTLIGLGLLGASCLPGGKLPASSTPPSRGGAPLRPLEADLPPDEGPLKLAFSTPQGDEVEAPLPTFVFTRSMHRLGAPPDDPPVVATIDPPLEGSWRWVGARALQFSPRDAFAQATRYRVEVRSKLRSLDGQTLDEPLLLDFATPRLRVLDLSLGDASDGILSLSFNQPVAPAALERAFSLVDEDGKKVPFRVDTKEPSAFITLRPRPRWPADVALRATLAPLSGVQGPLGTTEPRLASFRERQPVGVERLSCSHHRADDICEEVTSVDLSLGVPLTLAQLRPLVKIDPPLPFKLKPDGKPYLPSTSFTLEAAFKLGVRYRVSVRSSPPRKRGQPGLDTGAELSFRTAPPEPSVNLLVHGTYLHPTWTQPLHATVERVDSARFSVTPLTLAALLARRAGSPGQKAAATPSGELSFAARTDDEKQWAAVPLGALFPDAPGPLILAASWKGSSGQGETSRILQRTDLALSARLSPEGSLLWVTRLSSGLPVAGAEVEIHDLDGHKIAARTDPQGLAALDLGQLPAGARKKGEPSRDQLLLVARSGDDWLYQEAQRPREARIEATLFTDRDIYRPGEALFIKGIARQPSSRGPIPPEGRELSLTIELPDGPPLTLVKKLSSWGAFSHEFTIPPGTPPRNIRLSLKQGEEGRGSLATATVKVRHVREASFKVSASLDRPHYFPGDPFSCRGNASYLYGGSMQSMPYDATVTARTARYTVPGLEGLLVGDDARFHISRPLLRHRGNLEAGGAFAQEGKIDDASTSRLLRCGVTVTDPGQQVIEGEATAWVHPADFYVAVKEIGWREAEAGKELKLQIAAASPEGQRRAEKVKAALLEERPRDGKDEPDLVPITSCDALTSVAELAPCSLRVPPRHETRYRVEISATDPRGRVVRTTTSFRTPEKPRPVPVAPPPPPRPPEPRRPPLLALDRFDYKPGDTARLTISPTTPFGRGLLILGREGLFAHRVFSAQESPLDLPITAAMAPDARISVVLQTLIPTEVPYKRLEAQERASELLRVARPPRQLQVELNPSKAEAAPGETITVDLKVTDAGAPARAEVTLYAVNEGMLLLSDYQVPDLVKRLPLEGEHLILLRETRSDLGWLDRPSRGGTGSGFGFGSGHGRLGGSHGASAPSQNLPRSDFRPTPLFLPTLETDGEGRARASFKLPDSLTAYRIMAVVADRSDHFGRAEATVTAKLALQIRPVIPQVIRAGDRFEAAAIAANNTAAALDVTVHLQAEGFETPANAPRKLRLEPGASERVTFPVEARRVGPGKLTFRLEGGDGLRDAAEAPLTAQSPVSLEASALYGKTEGATLESVADLSTIRGDVGGLDLTVSSSPVSGLAPGLEQLVEYPYGCTEQLTSRLVPLVALRGLARALAVSLPEDVEDASKRAVEALLKNRHKDGRFGLWPSSEPSPWVTAYAYWGLSEVHRRGLPVDAAIFQEAARNLTDLAGRWAEGKRQAAEATFALDVLVDLPGADDTARSHALILARQMVDHRADLPAFARSQLLHALARLGAPPDELAPLVRDLEASLHLDGPVARVVEPSDWYPELLDTRARSSAMALRALLAAAPGHPMLEPLARGLIADRGPKGWKTTQESTWVLLALDGYRSALGSSEAVRSARVSVGGRSLLEAPLRGLAAESRAQVTMAELAGAGGADLLFQAQGGGPVYYQARLRYAPVEAPTTPLMAGIEVTHRCRKLDAKESGEEASFRVGDWALLPRGGEHAVAAALRGGGGADPGGVRDRGPLAPGDTGAGAGGERGVRDAPGDPPGSDGVFRGSALRRGAPLVLRGEGDDRGGVRGPADARRGDVHPGDLRAHRRDHRADRAVNRGGGRGPRSRTWRFFRIGSHGQGRHAPPHSTQEGSSYKAVRLPFRQPAMSPSMTHRPRRSTVDLAPPGDDFRSAGSMGQQVGDQVFLLRVVEAVAGEGVAAVAVDRLGEGAPGGPAEEGVQRVDGAVVEEAGEGPEAVEAR
jgi:uncharacterized protein YfaS (alpha-2-macroglobulin family)